MNLQQLQEEYNRLSQRIRALDQQPAASIDPSEWRELVENFDSLAAGYRRELAEAQARIAELSRELFGPKADRLTPEQQDQMNQLLADMEAESQQPAPDSADVLEQEESPKESKRRRKTRHPLPAEMETETIHDRAGPGPVSLLRQNAGPHWRRSFRGNRHHSGAADPPQNRAAQVCLPLR